MANPGIGNVLRRMRWLFAPLEPDPASDRLLLERFAERRDEAAFAELVRRHGPMVLGIAERVLADGNDAHDAFQAAFLVLMRKADSAGWQDSISGWLHRVAFRAALKIKAAAQRRRTHETQAANMAPALTTDPVWSDLRGVLDEELDRLPEKYRTPLVLCYIEGKTNEDAAKALGWPAGSMSRRLEKGRKLLRARLTKRGVALTGAALAAAITPQAATAAVPPALADVTVKAALGAMSFSAPVSAVADALVKQMFFAKVKLAVAGLLVLGLVGVGAGLAMQAVSADRPVVKPAEKDQEATRWSPPHRVLKLPHAQIVVNSVSIAPGGKLLAVGGSDHHIRLFDLQTDAEAVRFDASAFRPEKKAPGISRVVFAADGNALAAAGWHGDGGISVWNVADKSGGLLPVHGDLGGVTALGFTPDSKRLAFQGEKGLVTVRTLHGGEQVHLHSAAPVGSLAISPNGQRIATAENDGRVRLWDATSGKHLRTIEAEQCTFSGAQAVAFSPDSKLLATAGMRDGAIRLWNTETGEEVGKLGGEKPEMIRSVDFSADGKYLAAADSEGIRLYDRQAGKLVRLLQADLYPRCPAVFSPDGKLLAAGGHDGTVHLWNLERR